MGISWPRPRPRVLARQRLADVDARHVDGSTLPSIWTAGAVLAFAIKGGWRWAAFASTFVGVANIAERGERSMLITMSPSFFAESVLAGLAVRLNVMDRGVT